MHLASDYVAPTPQVGRCRVRVFLPDNERDSPVVILTELADNPGLSLTHAVKEIATKVVLDNELPPNRTVFIEHHEDSVRGIPGDPVTFDLLTFSNDEAETEVVEGSSLWRIDLGKPRWSALDCASVERLVGRPVD